MQFKIPSVSPRNLTFSGQSETDIEYKPRREYLYLSRYSVYRQIIDTKGNKYFESVNKSDIEESDGDRYYTVIIRDENRLDVISNNCYGVQDYCAIIGIANEIIDPLNIPSGTILRIPPISSVYNSEVILWHLKMQFLQ